MASKFSLEPIFLLRLSPSAPAPAPYGPPVRHLPRAPQSRSPGLGRLLRPAPFVPAPPRLAPQRPAFPTSIPFARPHPARPLLRQSRSRGPTGTGLSDLNPVHAAPQGPVFPTSLLFTRPHSVRLFRFQSRPPGRLLPRPAPAQSGPAPSTPFLFTLSLQSRSRSATTHSRLVPSISLTYLFSSPHPVRLVVFLPQAPFLPPHPRGSAPVRGLLRPPKLDPQPSEIFFPPPLPNLL